MDLLGEFLNSWKASKGTKDSIVTVIRGFYRKNRADLPREKIVYARDMLLDMPGAGEQDNSNCNHDQREEGGRRQRQREEEAPEESQRRQQPPRLISTNGGREGDGASRKSFIHVGLI